MKTSIPVFSLLLINLLYPSVFAQLSEGGVPYSFQSHEKSAAELQFIKLPPVDVDKLLEEDKLNTSKNQPWRFGKDIFVQYSPANSGTWEKLPNGDMLWRLGIVSKDALSLSFTFSKYRLPEGASLFIYNESHTALLGAFTARNNQADNYFATTLVEGDVAILEYYEPAGVEFPGELELWRITHAYRSISDSYKAFGASGDCNVNAACPAGDPIRDQIRSVAVLMVGGGACTGTLINNTNKDGTPYLLTADHCYSNPGTAVLWFNWESEDCANPSLSPSYNSLSGAVTRARHPDSDFWLLELNDTPPEEFNVYYSGWNRTTTAVLSGMVYGIHHPSVDIKKISWSDGGVDKDYYLGEEEQPGDGNDYWRVNYWSDGTTTEQGSSGSALFDKNKRIIGQLSGGNAACGNTSSDWYGRLGESWSGGGTDNTRLSTWLDPVGLGVTTLDGYEPLLGNDAIDGRMFAIHQPSDSYLDTVEIIPKVVIQNYGSNELTTATVQYTLNYDTTVLVNWTGLLATGKTDTVEFDALKLPFGKHNFSTKIIVTNDENPNNDSLAKNFTLVDCGGNYIPVAQGFNSPSSFVCWNKTIINGTDVDLSVVENGIFPACSPTEGSHLLEFNSWTSETGTIRINTQALSTEGYDSVRVMFDWYHDAAYPGSNDRVIVQYSLDGGSWISVEEVLRNDDVLSGWDRKTITLPEITYNNREVYFALLFVSAYGNNCHLDSLIISGNLIGEPYPDFYAEPQIAFVDSMISFTDASLNGPFTSWEWDFGDGASPPDAMGKGPHMVFYPDPGVRTVILVVDDTLSRIKTDYITINEGLFPPANLSATKTDQNSIYLLWDPLTLFSDGFETGNLSKWDTLIQGEGTAGEEGKQVFWHVGDEYSFDGNYGVISNWGYDIDSWIISPELVVSNDQILRFNWVSSYFYHIPEQNGDLMVNVSTDDGETWETIWQFSQIGEWLEWEWYVTTIDLSEYEGLPVKFAFQILADDNADVALDNIYLGDGIVKNSFGTVQVSESIGIPAVARSNPMTEGLFNRTDKTGKAAVFANYTVYRNDLEIAQTVLNFYTDQNVPIGLYDYYVTTTYSDPQGVSPPSNIAQVEITTGLAKTAATAIKLYPNPGNGLVRVESDHIFELTATDIRGQVILKRTVEPPLSQIDLTHQKAGIYILQFKSGTEIEILKLIIR